MDPLADEFASHSPYHYAYNNPLRFIAPDGRSADDIILKGTNNSSVTITTDLLDISIDASSIVGDLGGNHTIAGTDAVITGLDIVGVVDPTPISDALAASMSASQGDYWGAGASVLGAALPLVGDLAKGLKIAKGVQRIRSAISKSKGNVSLHNNALVAAVEGGERAAVVSAIGGRNTTVSMQAAKELLVRGDKQQLRSFMTDVGATISTRGGSAAQTQALRAQAASMGRSLKVADSRVAADAINNNATLLTRDRKLQRFMNAAGYRASGF